LSQIKFKGASLLDALSRKPGREQKIGWCTSAEQAGEKRDEGRADQGHAAASHELFYP